MYEQIYRPQWNKEKQEVPVDKDGNQLHYAWWHGSNGTYIDNHVFIDTLTYTGFSRGRSAAYFEFDRKDGRKVTVFLRDLGLMLPHFTKGTISGTFTFVKAGANYGCKFVSKKIAQKELPG